MREQTGALDHIAYASSKLNLIIGVYVPASDLDIAAGSFNHSVDQP